MSKYIPDVLSRRWVIVSPQRSSRPGEKKGKYICPLCEKNESLTPPEVFRYGQGQSNTPGWLVRVIPNKYPITDYHEVIVHSPSHDKDIWELPLAHIELIIKSYRERYNYYKNKGQVIIFCNRGKHAGASLDHPHSQLVVIPGQINLDTLSREPLNNIVTENDYFNVYCPDFSQWPYEVWISPKKDVNLFGNVSDEEIKDLADIMQRILHQLKKIYDKDPLTTIPFGYNYYIYPKENWYIRVIPRFVNRAGFELGTGLNVNIVDPIDASLQLKGVEHKIGKVLKKLKHY